MPILYMDTNLEVFNEEFKALREVNQNDLCNLNGFKYAIYELLFNNLMISIIIFAKEF